MVTFFVAVVALILAFHALTPPLYQSEGLLHFRPAPVNSSETGIPRSGFSDRQAELNSAAEILASRVFQEAVLEEVGTEAILFARNNSPGAILDDCLDRADAEWGPWWKRVRPVEPRTDQQQALAILSDGLTVRASGESNVVHVAFEGPTPEVARQVVDKLMRLYQEQHVTVHRASGSLDRLTAQAAKVEKELHAKQSALRDLKNRTRVAAVDLRRETLMERIGRMEDQLLETDLAIFTARAKEKTLKSQLAELPDKVEHTRTSGVPNQGLDLMRSQLYALQLKEQELLSIYRDDAPQVKDIRRQIVEAQKLLGDEAPNVAQISVALSENRLSVQRELLAAQSEAAAFEQRLGKLEAQLAAMRGELEQLNAHELPHDALERETELLESSLARYTQALHQARINEALRLEQSSNVSVVQWGTLSAVPTWPNRPLDWSVGLAVAVLGAFGLAMVAERFQRPAPAEQPAPEVTPAPSPTPVSRLTVQQRSADASLASIPR